MRFLAIPEDVPRAREAIREQLAVLDVGDQVLANVSVAVTEAVGNVVRHAYRNQPDPGDFEIKTTLTDDTITIAVRDKGCGPIPNPDSEGIHMGIPLMSALADTFSIEGEPGQGTSVRMTFSINEGVPVRHVSQSRLRRSESRGFSPSASGRPSAHPS